MLQTLFAALTGRFSIAANRITPRNLLAFAACANVDVVDSLLKAKHYTCVGQTGVLPHVRYHYTLQGSPTTIDFIVTDIENGVCLTTTGKKQFAKLVKGFSALGFSPTPHSAIDVERDFTSAQYPNYTLYLLDEGIRFSISLSYNSPSNN